MKIAKNLRNLLFRGFSPVWWVRKFLYLSLAPREAYKRRNWKSPQDSNDPEISNLNREGFLSLNFWGDEVTRVIDYCLHLSEKLDPLNQAPSQSEGKDFWRLLVAGEEVADHPTLLNFAHLQRWKTLASSYLGQEAVLSYVTLMKSYPIQKSPKHSQNWHLDADDSRNLVFYLYINDVTQHNGPFELIPKSAMKPLIRPRYFRKYAMSDQEINKYLKTFSPKSLIGVSGTMFACDTSTTYHRGSRCESSVRLALAFRYQTFTGLYPFKVL
jgi:hypothetical protein